MAPLATKTSQTPPVKTYKLSGISIVDYLTTLLQQSADSLLTHSECQIIIKSLMIFSFETPFAVAENLFKLDQVSMVDSFDLTSVRQVKYRNWQWTFFVSSYKGDVDERVEQVAWRKSKAVEMGRLITSKPNAAAIIGYWIVKLYQGRYPNILLYEFTECVKKSYYEFLKWQGFSWREKKIPPKALTKVCSFLYASPSDVLNRKPNRTLKNFWTSLHCLEARLRTQQTITQCEGIGIIHLSQYILQEVHFTLKELRDYEFKKNKFSNKFIKKTTSKELEDDEKKINPCFKQSFVLDAPKKDHLPERCIKSCEVEHEGKKRNAAAIKKEDEIAEPFKKRFKNNNYALDDFYVTYLNYPVMKVSRIKEEIEDTKTEDI